MADQRDEIAQAMMSQQGAGPALWGTNPDTGKPWANGYEELAWYQQQQDADPDAQYFANKGPMSGNVTDMGWMQGLQPWQGGVSSGDIPGSGINRSGFAGGGGAARADPAYWGWQGRGQGYAPGSMGDVSGFNAGRGGGGGRGGTGGLTPQDFAIFSRLVSPQALQQWLDAGGVQGQFGGGGMGGAGGGGGGGGQGPGGGGQGPGGGGANVGNANVGNANVGNSVGRGGMSMGDALSATVNATPEGFGTFGNMTGPGIGNALGGSNNNSLGGLAGGYSALGNMGTPAGYGNENGFTADGGGLSEGGFY